MRLTNQLALLTVCLLPWLQTGHAQLCHAGCMCFNQGSTYSTQCVHQNLTEIPAGIPNTTSMLQLEGNTFRVLPRNSLSIFPQLRSLSITHSNIEELENGAFHGLQELAWLDLKHNKIRVLKARIFSGLPSLDRLELDHNLLSVIEGLAFSGIGSDMLGVTISLQMNPTLEGITEHAFLDAKVETLLMSNSSLTSAALETIRDLRHSLRLLFLKNNRIPLQIPDDLFTGFILRTLDVSGNGIMRTNFLSNLRTESLSMQNNPLGSFDLSMYPSLTSVRNLYLDNTGFSNLNYSYFSGLRSLEQISLGNNNIVTISNEMRPFFQRLQGISLVSNPLHCNCDMKWLHAFVKRKERVFSLGAECVTPMRKSMFEMRASEFKCTPPTAVTLREVYVDGYPMLQCLTKADPSPTITWTLPGGEEVVIPPRTTYSPVISVYLTLQTNSSSGMYTCVASNHLGSHSNHKHVDIFKIMVVTSGNHTSDGPRVFSFFSLSAFVFLLVFL